MPVPNRKNETYNFKKQRRWSLIGILSKKKKNKKSQESMDFCPYDGKINQKVAQNIHLERSSDCLIEQYTCSPRLTKRCNSLQYNSQVSSYLNNSTSQPTLNDWKSSQQSIYSSSSSTCYSDIGVYKIYDNNNQLPHYIEEKNEQRSPVLKNVSFRCSSEIEYYQNKNKFNQKLSKSFASQKKLIGKKIPPPPPPRDPSIKAIYYFDNNELMCRESDSTYVSQNIDNNIPNKNRTYRNEIEYQNKYYTKEPPRSRRPIQIRDVETLLTESESSMPKIQSVEEALQELEDIYNSLGLSDEDLFDRAERRDLPTIHQNMCYQNFDELNCVNIKRNTPKIRRSNVPDIISDDMAYRRLNKRESKRQDFVPGSFLLVFPTIYNLDSNPKPSREPDITLDDVVFRSRRQHLNFFKTPDPQPPFGIPLGPIIGAAPSDYLHAIPEGRYKPSCYRRKIPDTVEDDLAFRTLRKDNKHKTSIDFSFIHHNKIKIDDCMPKINRNKIKNDTQWIIKKTPSNCLSNKNQVKFVFDNLANSVTDNQNLMVVKINHHKPIMLSGFTLGEANQLSKSFFCTTILQHEPHKICLTNDTYTPNNTPQFKLSHSLNIFNKPNKNMSSLPSKNVKKHYINNVLKDGKYMKTKSNTLVHFTNLNDGLIHKGMYGKNLLNFRDLINREYAYRYPLTEIQSNTNFVEFNQTRVTANCNECVQDEIKSRFKNNDENTSRVNSTAIDLFKFKTENHYYITNKQQPFESATTFCVNEPENQIETSTSSYKNASASSDSVSSEEYPNCMPGSLEDGRHVN